MLTVIESAEKVGVSVSTVRRWIDDGVRGRKLRAYRVGGVIRIEPRDLDEFMLPTCASPRPAVCDQRRALGALKRIREIVHEKKVTPAACQPQRRTENQVAV
jgi:excisionase family DNA binding protein